MSDNETDRALAAMEIERNALRISLDGVLAEAERLRTVVIDHINQRPEYIQALRNTRGDGAQADYFRWSGHAEARRQLAQKLDLRVPNEFGERLPVTTTNDAEAPR